MAFSVSTVWRVMNGGADGNAGSGGGFDAGQTAGMATDGAASSATTSAPVFSSASYNFVSGDIGAWVYIASGTNWIPGWYQIVSVASNAATLTATIGTATQKDGGLNTLTGCATTASPTAATWSIDYSLQTTAQFTYSDLTAAGAGSTFTSAGNPFGVQQVGNIIAVSAGTNCTVQRVAIISVSGVTATFDKAVTTGVTSNGAGKMGAAFASPGQAGALHISSNTIYIKYNATPYTSTSTTSNVTVGRVTLSAGAVAAPTVIRGYDVTPGDLTSNRPTMIWGVNAASNALLTVLGSNTVAENLILDGNRLSFTATRGMAVGANQTFMRRIKFKSFLSNAVTAGSSTATYYFLDCEFTDCTTSPAFILSNSATILFENCNFHDNTTDGINGSTFGANLTFINCIFATNNNSASNSAVVLNAASARIYMDACVIYNSGSHGVDLQTIQTGIFRNCIFEANGGYGINFTTSPAYCYFTIGCAFYNNTSGNYPAGSISTSRVIGEVNNVTGSFFNNAGSADFGLNSTVNQGALARATGYYPSMGGATTTNFQDIGAFQHQDSGGGGTTIINVME